MRADWFSCSTWAAPSDLPSAAATCILTEPRKTCEVVTPRRSTSTPNSVPRSVTMAVGVRTVNKWTSGRVESEDWRLGIGDSRFQFAIPLVPRSFSTPRRQLAEREEAAGRRFDFIRHRALQDDLRPGVVGDFHQAGGQGELVAERDEGRESSVEIGF